MVEIRNATQNDISEICNFHKRIFSDYYLSHLGYDVLYSYYNHFIMNPGSITYIAINDNKVIGIALTVKDFENTISKFYKSAKSLIIKGLIKGLFRLDKVILKNTFSRISKALFLKEDPVTNPKGYTLLSLAVDSSFQGKNISQKLIENTEQDLSMLNQSNYYLSVLPGNLRAINFYKKIGFVVTRTTKNKTLMEKNFNRIESYE